MLDGLGLLAGCGTGLSTGQPENPRRIGFLSPDMSKPLPISADAFLQGLRDLGYVEGRNIEIEYRWGEGRDAPKALELFR